MRKIADKFIITKKGEGTYSREEEEMEINDTLFRFLGGYDDRLSIKKERYYYPLDGGLIAEIDCYKGELEGFYTVEVEFLDDKAMYSFTPPKWFGLELTERKDLTNYAIAKHGLPEDLEKTLKRKGDKV